MHKQISVLILIFIIAGSRYSESQTSPSLQFTTGPAFPEAGLKGELVTTNPDGVSFINEDFIKKNYAVSTGVSITGTLKFPFDKKGFIKGLIVGSYSYFNIFRQSFIGTTLLNSTTIPVTFDNRFSTTTFGLGVEFSPLPVSKISPFINTNFTFNILSLTLSKDDFASVIFNDALRGGLLTNAGIMIRLSNEYSISAGGSLHLSNLLFKSHKEGFSDRIEFNRESVPINDEEGSFYTNLSNPGQEPYLVNGVTKKVNWWGINIGLNIMLGNSKKK